jgi:hypothetical protein
MAKIEKLKKGTSTIYPATIPQAVVDPTSGKSAREELNEKANHGYDSSPKTLKEIDDSVSQLSGDVSVKIENLIVNGDFRNGVEGWNLYSGALFEDGYIKIVGETRSTARTFTGDVNAPGDKIYSSVYIGVNTLSVTPYIYDSSFAGGSLSIITALCPVGYTGQASVITSVREGVGAGQQVLLTSGSQTRTGYFTFKDLITINLTQAFGAGNEPTKEEMDLLISTLGTDYFEGEITIPAQKIMLWQLAMIRQNRNAIIALSGTII